MALTTTPSKPIREALGLSRSIALSGERWSETAEQVHDAAIAEVERLERIIAWYWRNHGPYPSSVDEGQ